VGGAGAGAIGPAGGRLSGRAALAAGVADAGCAGPSRHASSGPGPAAGMVGGAETASAAATAAAAADDTAASGVPDAPGASAAVEDAAGGASSDGGGAIGRAGPATPSSAPHDWQKRRDSSF